MNWILSTFLAFIFVLTCQPLDSVGCVQHACDANKKQELPDKEECEATGPKLCKLKPGMSDEDVLETLGLGEFSTLPFIAGVDGGIGAGGIRRKYFEHLVDDRYQLDIVTDINSKLRYLEWRIPESVTIRVNLANE